MVTIYQLLKLNQQTLRIMTLTKTNLKKAFISSGGISYNRTKSAGWFVFHPTDMLLPSLSTLFFSYNLE